MEGSDGQAPISRIPAFCIRPPIRGVAAQLKDPSDDDSPLGGGVQDVLGTASATTVSGGGLQERATLVADHHFLAHH
jgi:hypothetical protein